MKTLRSLVNLVLLAVGPGVVAWALAMVLGHPLSIHAAACIGFVYIAHVVLCVVITAVTAHTIAEQERMSMAAKITEVADKLMMERAARTGLN